MPKGICYLVGAGPGDPLLMTLKGRECIKKADVIVYDYLCNPVFLNWARPNTEMIYAGKRCGAHIMTQEEINRLLIDKTSAGNTVVRLKGGDPFLFGRGGEEATELVNAGCAFEAVPGVSSAISGSIYAGIPLTHRAHNTMITIFTGHESPEKLKSSLDFSAIAKAPGTKVMLMGIKRLALVTQELLAEGMDKDLPVALVRWATTSRQESLVGTLSNIAVLAENADFKAPAIAVFGEVVALREKLNWFEALPLFGKTIAVARDRNNVDDLVRELCAIGADAFEMPISQIEPAPDKRAFYETVAYSHGYEWIILRTPIGSEAFFKAFFELYKDAREIGGARIAAFGPGTSEQIATNRLSADIQNEKSSMKEIIKALEKETSIENLKILLQRAEGKTDELAAELTRLGAIVDEFTPYETVPAKMDAPAIRRFLDKEAHLVVLTTPSAAEGFHALNLPDNPKLLRASVCPATTKAMNSLGMPVDIEARHQTTPGLLTAISGFYK